MVKRFSFRSKNNVMLIFYAINCFFDRISKKQNQNQICLNLSSVVSFVFLSLLILFAEQIDQFPDNDLVSIVLECNQLPTFVFEIIKKIESNGTNFFSNLLSLSNLSNSYLSYIFSSTWHWFLNALFNFLSKFFHSTWYFFHSTW